MLLYHTTSGCGAAEVVAPCSSTSLLLEVVFECQLTGCEYMLLLSQLKLPDLVNMGLFNPVCLFSPSCCVMIYFLFCFVRIAGYLCCVSHPSTVCPLLFPHSHSALSIFPSPHTGTACSEGRRLGLSTAEPVLQIKGPCSYN